MTKEKISLKMYQEKPPLLDTIIDHAAFKWITKNSKNIFYGLLTLMALLFVIYRMSANDQLKAENDYFTAAKDFNTFSERADSNTDVATQEQAFRNLEKILTKRPELNSKYDALLAQALLIKDRPQDAIPYAERTLARTAKENLPIYQEFSNATLLIAQGNFNEALQHSGNIKLKIDTIRKADNPNKEVGETLYAYNLIRIPLLEKQLGNTSNELAAWENLKAYLYENQEEHSPELRETRVIFDNLFAEGSVSLKNYIDYRVQEIKTNTKNSN